jgi:hypothetical protein
VIASARVTPSAVCSKRTARCRNTDATVSFVLSEDALVSLHSAGGELDRLSDARAGPNAIRVSARGVAPGRRALILRATDQAGNHSSPVSLGLTVRRR